MKFLNSSLFVVLLMSSTYQAVAIGDEDDEINQRSISVRNRGAGTLMLEKGSSISGKDVHIYARNITCHGSISSNNKVEIVAPDNLVIEGDTSSVQGITFQGQSIAHNGVMSSSEGRESIRTDQSSGGHIVISSNTSH